MTYPTSLNGLLSRRDSLRIAAGAATSLLLPASRMAAQQAGPNERGGGSGDESDGPRRRTREAVERGLEWLADKQQEDGSFLGGQYARDPAIVGLAGKAFLAAGGVPGRGHYGETLDRCIRYLMEHVDENGFIRRTDGGGAATMYGHGYATAFLAEAYHVAMEERLRAVLQRAVKLLADSQSDEGGWRYVPRPGAGADVSVTSCQLLALSTAKDAGIEVPERALDAAVEYVRSCQNEDGGFRYIRGTGGSALPRSAAAVAALQASGRTMKDVLKKGMAYLDAHRAVMREAWRQSHFGYAAYYATQAMCRAANDDWKSWHELLRSAVLDSRKDNGVWSDTVGPVYATAVACYVLGYPLAGR